MVGAALARYTLRMAQLANTPAGRGRVLVCGPATWNELVYLDHLPAPVPRMVQAQRAYHALGGTSAGKAVNLTHLHDYDGSNQFHRP